MKLAASRAYEAFWTEFEISSTKLRWFRLCFFSVLALDAWQQIAHAPRYGVRAFNVSHFPVFDGILPMPTRAAMVAVYGLQTYLALRIAWGGASRLLYVALAVLFSGGYFVSQLNSYQHHYLVAIILGLMAAFPWPDIAQRRGDRALRCPPSSTGATWPVRMVLIAMTIMYFFATIAKLDGEWLDGSTLQLQVQTGWLRDVAEHIGWSTLATLTAMVELSLAVLIHIRRLWPLAVFLGVSMHMIFELSGLEIGLFSYFMLTLYMVLIPEHVIRLMSKHGSRIRVAFPIPALSAISWPPVHAPLLCAGSLLASTLIFCLIPLQPLGALVAAILLIAVGDAAWHSSARSVALPHMAAAIALVAMAHYSNSIRDYYRFWGGNERRAGNIEQAIAAYEHVVHVAPNYASGRKNLGDLYRSAQRPDDALAQYEAGIAASPDHWGVHREAARIYHQKGMGPQALRAARKAVKLQPTDKDAKQIQEYWRKKLGPHASRPES